MTSTWLLAHQGGWDEILMVLAPIGIFGGLLYLSTRGSRSEHDPDGGAGASHGGSDPE